MSDVAFLEAWLSRKELCERLGCSPRYLSSRMQEGLPHAVLAGRCKFRQSVVEGWLMEHGHMELRSTPQPEPVPLRSHHAA